MVMLCVAAIVLVKILAAFLISIVRLRVLFDSSFHLLALSVTCSLFLSALRFPSFRHAFLLSHIYHLGKFEKSSSLR